MHIIIQSVYEKVKDDKGLGPLQIKLQNDYRRSTKPSFFDFFSLLNFGIYSSVSRLDSINEIEPL